MSIEQVESLQSGDGLELNPQRAAEISQQIGRGLAFSFFPSDEESRKNLKNAWRCLEPDGIGTTDSQGHTWDYHYYGDNLVVRQNARHSSTPQLCIDQDLTLAELYRNLPPRRYGNTRWGAGTYITETDEPKARRRRNLTTTLKALGMAVFGAASSVGTEEVFNYNLISPYTLIPFLGSQAIGGAGLLIDNWRSDRQRKERSEQVVDYIKGVETGYEKHAIKLDSALCPVDSQDLSKTLEGCDPDWVVGLVNHEDVFGGITTELRGLRRSRNIYKEDNTKEAEEVIEIFGKAINLSINVVELYSGVLLKDDDPNNFWQSGLASLTGNIAERQGIVADSKAVLTNAEEAKEATQHELFKGEIKDLEEALAANQAGLAASILETIPLASRRYTEHRLSGALKEWSEVTNETVEPTEDDAIRPSTGHLSVFEGVFTDALGQADENKPEEMYKVRRLVDYLVRRADLLKDPNRIEQVYAGWLDLDGSLPGRSFLPKQEDVSDKFLEANIKDA